MSKVVPFRLRTERDIENMKMLQEEHPHMNQSEILRWLIEDWRLRHDTRTSKAHKLDDIIEAVDVIDRKVMLLLKASGIEPCQK
jgi:hypothetical protein